VRAQLIGDEFALRLPVLIDVEFERLEVIGELDRGARESRENRGVSNLQRMVDAGLRAQLKTGSLLTGQKLISLDLFPEAPPVSVAVEGNYPIVPTIPSVLDTVTQQVAGLLEKLQRLPLESISAELLQTVSRVREIVTEADPQSALNALTGLLQQAEGLVGRLDQNIAPQLDETMQETSRFARNLNATLQPQLEDTLRELKDAARAIRTMSDYLERHPEALIKGKQP
jgi:paraquat-inducible protein B